MNINSSVDFHLFTDRQLLSSALADSIANLLSDGISQKGRASLAVSGGSTPVQLFKSLSVIDIPWDKVDIFLVDERWVAPTDTDSNENLVRTHLLQNNATAAHFSGMKNSAATASEGEAVCKENLQKIHRPFNVLVLGMGSDGHTASLFSGAVKLAMATDMNSGEICIGIAPVTAPHERMTLTLPEILASKQIFLHITGKDKKAVLEHALETGTKEEMPIRYVLQQSQKENFHIYWAE